MKERILFITNGLGFGGAEKMITFIAKGLSKRRYKCIIVNLNSLPDYVNAYRQEIPDEIKVYENREIVNGVKRHFFYINYIKKIVKAERINIMIAFTELPNFYSAIVSAITGVPSIMSERADPERTGVGKGLKNRIVLSIINRSRGGVFQTIGAMNYYGKGLRKRGTIIENPIAIANDLAENHLPIKEKTVISVGRLDNDQKRYDVMLKGFGLFHEKHSQYRLKIYGTGTDEDNIRNWIEELGLQECVQLMGVTKQPIKEMLRSEIFVITSDYEGIPNVLLEAMAVGLPCIATDCTPGGAQLLIRDHQNGLLIERGDSCQLAAALNEYAENTELKKTCGEQAKEVLHLYSPNRIISKWEDYIESL